MSKREHRRLFIGDLQWPFYDSEALTKIIPELRQADVIHFVGDIVDFYQVSSHLKDPKRLGNLYQDILDVKAWLRTVVRIKAPNAQIVWEDGNHEDRLRKYLWRQAPELADFPSLRLEELLGFKELEIEHRGYQQGSLIAEGNFLVTHGSIVRGQSAYTARTMLERYGISGLSGHTHRLGSHFHSNMAGERVWYENGCLCTLDGMEYVTHPNWQQGYSVGLFTGDKFQIQQHHIWRSNG